MNKNPIIVNKDLPTDNADILSGTALDPCPGNGVLIIFLASSQRDGVLTVGGPGVVGGGSYKVPPVLRTSGIPDVGADVPYLISVTQGRVICDYDEVAAGDAFATIMFISE